VQRKARSDGCLGAAVGLAESPASANLNAQPAGAPVRRWLELRHRCGVRGCARRGGAPDCAPEQGFGTAGAAPAIAQTKVPAKAAPRSFAEVSSAAVLFDFNMERPERSE